jgi:hypothetical protein
MANAVSPLYVESGRHWVTLVVTIDGTLYASCRSISAFRRQTSENMAAIF